MTGMYLILIHDLMSPMLGDITIIFLMISYFYDITISWHHNLYGLFLYQNKCGSIYLILLKNMQCIIF